MKPADDVGGDYYDVINTGGKDWVVIGDVSGHGVPAGLIMMMVQTSIQTLVRRFPDMKPSEVLSSVNEAIKYNVGNMKEQKYMTITVFSFDSGGKAQYSGLHQDLLVYRASSGKVDQISTDGMWLSPWDMGQNNIDSELKLSSGDILFLYTDGITEAKDMSGEMFSETGLIDILNRSSALSTEEIKSKVLEKLQGYRTDDDVTMMILRKV
jgi:serine phosphatase RsbU (regulator of sigma subunit)